MTAKTTKKASTEQRHVPDKKKGAAMSWLARHLRRQVTRQEKDNDNAPDRLWQISPPRPQTAPSIGTAVRGVPYPGIDEPPLSRPRNKPPPRPPRPDSNVIRDVNAWLDASMIKPAPQLMGGIPYWREGPYTGMRPSADVRYAIPIPILRTPEPERPTTPPGQHLKSFRCRAKKMQVRMPSLLRTRSRRSTSMPLLPSPEEAHPAPTRRQLVRSRSLMHMTDRSTPTTVSSQGRGWIRAGRPQPLGQHPRLEHPTGARFDDQESSMERRVNAVFGQTARLGDTIRPSTAGHRFPREDSMGNLSDAPTYFSGPPPPSYRSRAASVLSSSSFGCVDGMNRAQRQTNQHRSGQGSRGVKGKLGKFKKIAQKAHLTK